MKLITPQEEQQVIDCFRQSRGVYSMGPLIYPSGRRAPFNLDFVKAYCQPESLEIIGKMLAKTIKKIPDIELICGIATAGIPLAVAVCLYTGLPYVYARQQKHERTGEIIQGEYKKGQRAVLLDDIVGRGGTKVEILKLIGDELKILDLVVIFEPGPGYKKDFDEFRTKTSLNVYELTDWLTLTVEMTKVGAMPHEVGEIMIEYLKAPDDWQMNKQKYQKFLAYKEKSGLEFGKPLV